MIPKYKSKSNFIQPSFFLCLLCIFKAKNCKKNLPKLIYKPNLMLKYTLFSTHWCWPHVVMCWPVGITLTVSVPREKWNLSQVTMNFCPANNVFFSGRILLIYCWSIIEMTILTVSVPREKWNLSQVNINIYPANNATNKNMFDPHLLLLRYFS